MSENGTFGKRSPKGINLKTPAKCVDVDSKNGTFLKTLTSQQPSDSVAVPSQPLIQNGGRNVDYVTVPVWKRLMWTKNMLSVFAAKVAFSNLSGFVWT